jgi:hypothetical protein
VEDGELSGCDAAAQCQQRDRHSEGMNVSIFHCFDDFIFDVFMVSL